jgi:hypothetical protein
MWESRRLTNLWASTACYRDSLCTRICLLTLRVFVLLRVYVGRSSGASSRSSDFFYVGVTVHLLSRSKQSSV